MPSSCPNCGCLTEDHRHGGIGVCPRHGCEDVRPAEAISHYTYQCQPDWPCWDQHALAVASWGAGLKTDPIRYEVYPMFPRAQAAITAAQIARAYDLPVELVDPALSVFPAASQAREMALETLLEDLRARREAGTAVPEGRRVVSVWKRAFRALQRHVRAVLR